MYIDTGGEDQREGSKVQHMVNVEKMNQELDIMTMCHTENNEAQKYLLCQVGRTS